MASDRFNGKPVKPDVDMLLDRVNAAPGGEASADAIAKVLGLDLATAKDRARYRTVSNAYRKALRALRGLDTRSEAGQIKFLTDKQALVQGSRGLHRIARSTGRLKARVDQCVDPRRLPTDEDKASHMLLTRELMALDEASRNAVKSAALPKEAGGLPRLRVVNGEKDS